MKEQPLPRMTFETKLIFTTVLSIIWVLATIGEPSVLPDMSDLALSDYNIDYIFQTTLAVQTKVFRKRIVQEADGIWNYLPYLPYLNNQKWVELDIQLKTRIGFKLDGSSSVATLDPLTNNLNFNILEPTILDRQGIINTVQQSSNLFAKWDLVELDKNKKQLLDYICEAESQLQLANFKEDQNKMGSLIKRLQSQLDLVSSANRFSVRKWINTLNNRVNEIANSFLYMFTGVNKLQYPHREELKYETFNPKDYRERKLSQGSNTNTKQEKPEQSGKFKEITYNQQENRLRNEMRERKQYK